MYPSFASATPGGLWTYSYSPIDETARHIEWAAFWSVRRDDRARVDRAEARVRAGEFLQLSIKRRPFRNARGPSISSRWQILHI